MSSHLLQIRDLTVSYHRIPAVHHVNLELRCGHCIALLGPNGAGKTSFFKALVGLVKPETGSVSLGGHGQLHRDIVYLPQRENVDWDFPVTVRGLAQMGRYTRLGWWRRFGAEDHAAVDRALATMELTDLAHRQISALSGGQQQRAFLARALAQEAHVMLLDEPFTGLDRPAQTLLSQAMQRIVSAGNLVIASHHDLKTVPDLFQQVIFLNGELIAFGDTAEIFTEANIERAYGTQAFAGARHHHHHHS
ncbi:MAG TPA: metal ABC transporter ATP-binding protein [Chthoniobacterales bacterium]|nr:metal ABC transporter ATP-binding protein [Chthoniobacterales bacterium]